MKHYDTPDHPIVEALERTGHPYGKEPPTPRCPVCGDETDTLFKHKNGEILGCSNCICAVDAWEVDL